MTGATVLLDRLRPRLRRGNEPLTDIDLCAWIAQAVPGEILEYHRGALCVDRKVEISKLGLKECERIDHLADRALDAFDAGLVDLVQERLGPDHYRYLAIARSKTEATEQALSHMLMEDAA